MTTHPAEWMSQGTFGVMMHYLIAPPGDSHAARTAEFNRIVDAFDVDCFVQQVVDSGADWLIFTIGQNTGYYSSPNAFLDRALPGHTSRRDLVLEIARRIKAAGKRFIVYLPAEVAGQAADIKAAFAWNPNDQSTYLECYLAFVRDYSLKLGALHDGWWFDGCYDTIVQNPWWDWRAWLAAAKAGNPHSIVAFNDGAFCVGRYKPVTPLQDYHAGEIHLLEDGRIRTDFVHEGTRILPDGRLRYPGQTQAALYMPDARFIDGVQWHALLPLDSTFHPLIPAQSYSDDVLFKWAAECKAVGGAVTLNVPIDLANGHIPATSAAQLRRLGAHLSKHAA
jgi:hypothetical protein